MTDLIPAGNNQIQTIPSSLEPSEYFTLVKSSLSQIEEKSLKRQLQFIAKQILNARKVGQKNFYDSLVFKTDVLAKEAILISLGINTWVDREVVKESLPNIKPARGVKIIELSRYPRVIPQLAIDEISRVQQHAIFDDMLVLFTDLTTNDYQTKNEKDFVARNRDPIVLGIFRNEKTNEIHHRMYFIASWEDAYCNMTIDKFLSQLDADQHGKLSEGSIND